MTSYVPISPLMSSIIKQLERYHSRTYMHCVCAHVRDDSCKPINCENCEALQKKVNSLITTTSKHSMGTTNLNAILGSQNCVFEKVGIGYQIGFQGRERKYSSFFKMIEQRFLSPLTCFYCTRKGHYVRNCRIRKFDVPKGLVRWVPKSITNTCGPKFNRISMPQT